MGLSRCSTENLHNEQDTNQVEIQLEPELCASKDQQNIFDVGWLLAVNLATQNSCSYFKTSSHIVTSYDTSFDNLTSHFQEIYVSSSSIFSLFFAFLRRRSVLSFFFLVQLFIFTETVKIHSVHCPELTMIRSFNHSSSPLTLNHCYPWRETKRIAVSCCKKQNKKKQR